MITSCTAPVLRQAITSPPAPKIDSVLNPSQFLKITHIHYYKFTKHKAIPPHCRYTEKRIRIQHVKNKKPPRPRLPIVYLVISLPLITLRKIWYADKNKFQNQNHDGAPRHKANLPAEYTKPNKSSPMKGLSWALRWRLCVIYFLTKRHKRGKPLSLISFPQNTIQQNF